MDIIKSLRISGIPQNDDKKEDTDKFVIDLLKEMDIDITRKDLDRSKVEKANNSSVAFEFDSHLQQEEKEITDLKHVHTISTDQLITVQGRVTLHREPTTTKNGLIMQDKCFITELSDTVKLTLWNDLIAEIEHNSSYVLTNVRVKQHDSTKYLTATPNTTAKKATINFTEPDPTTFQDLFDFHVITATRVELLDHYKKSFCCRSCNKSLTEIPSDDVVKCQCGVLQEVNSCPQIASIRLQVRNSETDLIWLTAFQPVLEKLFDEADNINFEADENVISKYLFKKLKNFTLKYQGNTVKDISL
ncbi:hypothetical protein AC249_AIPGENE22809 [Exaiptasia diaphana]|nr:hypothetical protein AC249_AIPGENE22809 [Exaiptasia diaphana]